MLNNTVGGNPGLQLLWQRQVQQLLKPQEKRTLSVRGVWWLNEPKAERKGAPPEVHSWTCPQCRSHQCIRTNPGNSRQPIYCCVVCGYTFGAVARTRLPKATRKRPE